MRRMIYSEILRFGLSLDLFFPSSQRWVARGRMETAETLARALSALAPLVLYVGAFFLWWGLRGRLWYRSTRHLLPFSWGLPPKLPPHDSRCCCFQAEPGTRKYRAVRVAPCFPHNPCATCGRSCGFTDRELDVERHPCGLGCGCRFGTRARAPRASHTRLVPPPTILNADNPSPRRMIRESPPPAVCWGCKYVNPPECERLMCEDLVPEDTVAASASSAARAFVASGSAVLATLGKRVEDARRDRTARHARQDQGFQGAALNPRSAPPQPPTTTTTFAVGTAAPIEPPEIPPLAFPSTEPPATLAPAYPAPPFARAAEVPRPPPPPTTTTAATTYPSPPCDSPAKAAPAVNSGSSSRATAAKAAAEAERAAATAAKAARATGAKMATVLGKGLQAAGRRLERAGESKAQVGGAAGNRQ